MKTPIIYLICILAYGLSLKAQDSTSPSVQKTFVFGLTAGTGICMQTPKPTPLNLQAAGYYHLSEKFAFCAGTGYSNYNHVSLIPLFAGIRYNFSKGKQWTPYAECNSGYSFAPSDNANGGFLLSPSAGITYTLKIPWRLQASIGYEHQKLERRKSFTDPYFTYQFHEKLSHHMIMFRAGVLF